MAIRLLDGPPGRLILPYSRSMTVFTMSRIYLGILRITYCQRYPLTLSGSESLRSPPFQRPNRKKESKKKNNKNGSSSKKYRLPVNLAKPFRSFPSNIRLLGEPSINTWKRRNHQKRKEVKGKDSLNSLQRP